MTVMLWQATFGAIVFGVICFSCGLFVGFYLGK